MSEVRDVIRIKAAQIYYVQHLASFCFIQQRLKIIDGPSCDKDGIPSVRVANGNNPPHAKKQYSHG